MSRSSPPRSAKPVDRYEWISASQPPEPYDIVALAFEDGSVRTGTWNGKLWWGYDERVRRACELRPTAWQPVRAHGTAKKRAGSAHQRK